MRLDDEAGGRDMRLRRDGQGDFATFAPVKTHNIVAPLGDKSRHFIAGGECQF